MKHPIEKRFIRFHPVTFARPRRAAHAVGGCDTRLQAYRGVTSGNISPAAGPEKVTG